MLEWAEARHDHTVVGLVSCRTDVRKWSVRLVLFGVSEVCVHVVGLSCLCLFCVRVFYACGVFICKVLW